ncbi:MAG: aminotransferase class I/II-fold pyridoxal phosphate-dependent enzyme [Clostridia bacterium]|nr:aminotransferase class I/II-fold pyridoxal phosphate-dependent enzyme [Clostridia bacterium]MDD4376029.1 aminotransferase class I/II-fold pyridoxal phosphate-dependent enzyme [Clostridia bacterium]
MYKLTKEILEIYELDERVIKLDEKVEEDILPIFEKINEVSLYNQAKVHRAFKNNRISEVHFNTTTGYGYDDLGREAIEKVYADIFKAEDALVRIQFVSGTHSLSVALLANLMPGEKILSITGDPYDTLMETIGSKEKRGSLINSGVSYEKIDLINNEFDVRKIKKHLNKNKVNMIFIGRSRGYTSRKSLTIDKIEKIIKTIKGIDKNVNIIVDNCYGEFVEKKEPIEVGADIVAGSLIKNIGGGICETGGYIAGRKDLVMRCAERLTAPGIGKECGATLGKNKEILQGLYLAPVTVKNSIMTATYAARLAMEFGIKADPEFNEKRTDIVEQLEIGSKEKLIKFIQEIQASSPIDSFVTPEPWAMPGYADEVIMAAGTFVSGSSIELSADAPIKEPYIAYVQGGLTYEAAKLSVLTALFKTLGDAL